eukprot:301173_1
MFCASIYEDCVIRGNINCKLLSLLFQTAIYHAKKGRNVTFICDKQRMNKRLPLLNRNFHISENKQILESINIKYCNNLSDLIQFFTHFYLFNDNQNNIPNVIIINDIITLLEVSLFIHNNNDNNNDIDYYIPPDSTDEDEDNNINDTNNENNNNNNINDSD